MIKKCPECNSDIDGEHNFCPDCGKPLSEEKLSNENIDHVQPQKRKKSSKIITILVVCAIIVAVIIIAITQLKLDTIGTPSSKTALYDWHFKDNSGMVVVETSIIGDSDLEVVLIKDNSEIDSINVQKRQLEDGIEIVNLEMCNTLYETPKSGTYTIKIYKDDKTVDEKIILRNGAKLTITYFYPTFETYYSLNERIIKEFTVSYTNIGDLPAYVDQIYISGAMDSTYQKVSENSQYIGIGESTTLEGSTYLDSTYYNIKDIVTVSLVDSQGNALNQYYSWNEP